MIYRFLEEMSGLLASGDALEPKLKRALGLVSEATPFDEAALYMRADHGGFFLKARGGGKEGPEGTTPHRYDKGGGLGSLACKNGEALLVYTPKLADFVWKGLEDRAMMGCRTVLAAPLMDGLRSYGVLYLKARKKVVPTPAEESLLRIIILQLISIIKFSEVVGECRSACEEAEAFRERLCQAEKLILLGDIAATLAHEIKNPLICLGAYAARIKRKLAPSSPVIADVTELLKAVKRLEGVVNALVSPLKDDEGIETISDLNEILAEAVKSFREDMKERSVALQRDLFMGPLPVYARRQELKIIFDNLIANAIQCMSKEGGTLRLSTDLGDGWVIAEVSDTGGGIDPRDVASIFRPFFTTKKDGTGLGLPITSSIVSRHRGEIDVINRFGEGVTFKVKFPSATGREEKSPRL